MYASSVFLRVLSRVTPMGGKVFVIKNIYADQKYELKSLKT
jgi:hypothetical protein